MNSYQRDGLTTHFLGLMDYEDVWEIQKDYFGQLVEYKKFHSHQNKESISENDVEIPTEHLILTEHPAVITLGRHADINNVITRRENLQYRGIKVIPIERGGDVTYHGPGQLVAYPIIDLERHHLGVKKYVDMLEETVIRLIAPFGITGERVEGASGVWIGKGTPNERKIAAVGVKCSHFVTMHGIAININTDLTGFHDINPCGFVEKGVTSLQAETGKELDFNHITKLYDTVFREIIADH